MYLRRTLFILGLIHFAVSSLSVVKAMDNSDNDRDRCRSQRHSHSRSSSHSGSSICDDSDNETGTDNKTDDGSDSDSTSSSGGALSIGGKAPKRLKATFYLAAQEKDPFLRGIGATVYVRGVVKERGGVRRSTER